MGGCKEEWVQRGVAGWQGEGHRAVLTLSTGAGRNALFRSALPSSFHALQTLLTSPFCPSPLLPLSLSPPSPLSSANPSSQLTSELVDDVRLQLLHFFNADPQEYQVGARGREWGGGGEGQGQEKDRTREDQVWGGGKGHGTGAKGGHSKGGLGGGKGKGGGRLTGHGRKGACKEEGGGRGREQGMAGSE